MNILIPDWFPSLKLLLLKFSKLYLIILEFLLLLGMYVNSRFQKLTAIIAKPLKIFSIVAFLAIVAIAVQK